MKIAAVGLRGIPDVQGGIESHCQHLYPLLAKNGHEIILYRRKFYNGLTRHLKEWKGVKLVDLWAPHSKHFENIVHTFVAILKARRAKADVVHIHGIGPSLLAPMARLLGMKVVMTHHGRDYNRAKWGPVSKWVLRKGENIGQRYSNAIISVSQEYADDAPAKGFDKVTFIPNGFTISDTPADNNVISRFGLDAASYILGVGRLVKEKGFHDLVAAFKLLKNKDIKLVIAGDNDFDSPYSRELLSQANENVIFTGRLNHGELASLYRNASLFVLPSYHEGLPIVLLEAMSHNRPVVVSDIEVNRLPEIPEEFFYETGNVAALADKIQNNRHFGEPVKYDLGNYSWNKIAALTAQVFDSI